MTENLRKQIVIPVWLVTILISLFIPWLVYSSAQVKAQQNVATKVEMLQEEVKGKAEQSDVDRIYKTLDRIENKLDQQIAKDK